MGKIDEKNVLPQTHVVEQPVPAPSAKGRRMIRALAYALSAWLLVRLCLLPILYPSWSPYRPEKEHDTPSSSCAQAEPVVPQAFDTSELIKGNEGRIREWLSGAVRVPTEVFDVMGPIDEDPRWNVFYEFAECEPGHSSSGRWLINRPREGVPLGVRARCDGVEDSH
jgi:Gly-Xaa carboxypeptidase